MDNRNSEQLSTKDFPLLLTVICQYGGKLMGNWRIKIREGKKIEMGKKDEVRKEGDSGMLEPRWCQPDCLALSFVFVFVLYLYLNCICMLTYRKRGTCPWESTKVRELHWQPRLTKGEAAFRSFVRLSADEPVASRVMARKFIFARISFFVGSGVNGVE